MNDMPEHIRRGHETRQRVLRGAVKVATQEGLDALTIGRIAEANSLSKAGLLGHFPSKEALQIATLDIGREEFIEAVITPALRQEPGVSRLVSLLNAWITHVASNDGGCLLASVAAEFDGRSGPVRDHVARVLDEWLDALTRFIVEAKGRRHLLGSVDPEQLAFELHGYELSLNLQLQLLGRDSALARARMAMRSATLAAASASGKKQFTTAWKAFE
jgi:AcrR family transcriptional regulator